MSNEYPKAKSPLILRYHRMIEAFSKSNDEKDFYLDKVEGFIIYIDLNKSEEELNAAEFELKKAPDRYRMIPKLTFYETKKFMEGFVNEKVYDVDTKEKLLDIISDKESRDNFLEFIYDHLTELDKWQQYYHERSRIRIIEWLRNEMIYFVFEEDLELSKSIVEKLKEHMFDSKVSKDVAQARDIIDIKSKTYYTSEAINPKPKRGRPPKQSTKIELEPQFAADMYTSVIAPLRYFLFIPDSTNKGFTFSSKYENEEQLLATLRGSSKVKVDSKLEMLSQRLESFRYLSGHMPTFKSDNAEQDKKVSNITSATKNIVDDKSEPKLSKFIKSALPKKDEKSIGSSEMIEKKKKGIKKVTQISYTKNKKK